MQTNVNSYSAKLDEIETIAAGLVASGSAPSMGVFISKGGEKIYERMFGLKDIALGLSMEIDTIARYKCLAKCITGVAVMQLYENNKIKLSDPISRYIPSLQNMPVFSGLEQEGQMTYEKMDHEITIHELLIHSSGLALGHEPHEEQDPVDRLYYQAEFHSDTLPWIPKGRGSKTIEEFIERLSKLPLQYQPGTQTFYSVSYDVLSVLVEKVSGLRIDQYMEKYICGPLGMKATKFALSESELSEFSQFYYKPESGPLEVVDEGCVHGYSRAQTFLSGASSLISTLEDWSRFSQMLCNNGELDGTRVLESSTVAMMTHPSINPVSTSKFKLSYGCSVVGGPHASNTEAGCYFFAGSSNAGFWINPREKLLVVLAMNLFDRKCPALDYLRKFYSILSS